MGPNTRFSRLFTGWIDAPKRPARGNYQVSKSIAAADGVMGFCLVDGNKVAVHQIDGADREADPQHDC
jgi:hypothetical protein